MNLNYFLVLNLKGLLKLSITASELNVSTEHSFLRSLKLLTYSTEKFLFS